MTIRFPFPVLAFAALALCSPCARGDDALRIATVDMQVLFKDYHRTGEAQRELNVERARIQQSNTTRLETITALEGELQSMRKQLDDPSISDRRKQELFQAFQMKTQEGVALDRERREFLRRRNTALNEKMVLKLNGLRSEIRRIVADHAKQEDYDYVFDRSGLSTTQVPFLLYAKDATDLTPILLRDLNADAPKVSKSAGFDPRP